MANKVNTIVGNESNPTKLEAGQTIINKVATKQNLDKLVEINGGKSNPKTTTDGTEGGLLKGKPHYDANGKPTGGIPAVVEGGNRVELEGEEFVVSKEASKKHWKELSKINVSTKGNLQKIIENSKPFGCFNEELLKFYLSLPNYTFFMDDVAVGVVNFFDSEIFFSSFSISLSSFNCSFSSYVIFYSSAIIST